MNKAEELSPQETKLMELIRSIDYGELRVIIKENRPIRAEQIQKSIKLE